MFQQLASTREEVVYMIFLDLHKEYGSFKSDICLEILEVYSVGTRACRILWGYWDRLRMVACAGGYYGEAFKGLWGLI